MGRMRAKLKNVVVTGIIVCSVIFLWMLAITKQDGTYEALMQDRYVEMQEKLEKSDLVNKQRLNDLQILRSQFNFLVSLVTNNATNSSMVNEFPHIMKERGKNFSEELGSLHLPSIFTYLPHLTGHPDSLKPVFKLSKNRYGASIVMGIPTIRRERADYLSQTVKSLIEGMSVEEQNMCLIIVFVAEPWDKPYAEEVGKRLSNEFQAYLESGLLEVISPPAEFYPDMDNLKLTFGDTKERVRWRTKQNLDFTFLMLYARTRGFYYVQLEDDVIAKPGYFSIMKTYADQQKSNDWILLDFSALGFIGKLFKSSQIPVIVEFFLMFHKDKPIDWLLDHYLNVKVCSPEKDKKHCARMIAEVRKRFKPSLFQHVGMQSSLKGKTQKLKDKDFGKQAIYRAHVNPPATIVSKIKAYQKYFIKKAYIGEDVFWGLSPTAGDTVEIKFDPAIEIASYLFRSGNSNHPDDKFLDTVVEILPEGAKDDAFVKVGEFNKEGLASAEVGADIGKVSILRLKVLKESSNWVILSEENSALNELYLGHNYFREQGGELLGEGLEQNDFLRVFDVSWNHLRLKGAQAIGKALENNINLEVLNVAWNGFYIHGVSCISTSLAKNQALTDLDISCNRLSEVCLAQLLKGLEKNTALKKLKISRNHITDTGVMAVLNQLQKHPTIGLNYIDLGDQHVKEEFVSLLKELQQTRQIDIQYGMVWTKDREPIGKQDQTEDELALLNENPHYVLMEFMRLQKLRLVDLFHQMDTDKSKGISVIEFQEGLKVMNIPLKTKTLEKFVKACDTDKNGEIDYIELVEANKKFKEEIRRVAKLNIPLEKTDLGRIQKLLRKIMLNCRGVPHNTVQATAEQSTESSDKTAVETSNTGTKSVE